MNNEPLNDNDLDGHALFLQIRTAHRLLAAYYQRLLPTIEQISIHFETDYWFWETCRFSKTARNPFTNWKWDMLPATIPRYVFKNINSLKSLSKGDFILEFIVINDTGIRDESKKTEPNALDLKVDVTEANSTLKLNVYTSHDEREEDFYQYWNQLSYPKPNNDLICTWEKGFVTTAFEVPLSDLISENGVRSLKSKIEACLKATLDYKQ